jgi:cytochrome c oxidase accessory protein FixG
MSYAQKRYVFYFFATAIALALPFITVDGNHFFLFNFDSKQLHLLFTKFDMQELYLMPFLLIMLFLGIFLITVLGGRVFCGWSCPQTIFRVVYRDLIETKILGLRKKISNKQKEPDLSTAGNKFKKVVAILLWSLLALIAGADFLWFFIPPETFFEYIQNPEDHTVLMIFWASITLFLIYDVIWLQEDFCAYICPYSRVQSVLYDDDTVMAIYDKSRGGDIYDAHHNKIVEKQKELPENAECTTCEKCVTVCPTHIDIRKGLQLECINCLECVDACTTVMGKLDKPTLVTWSSVREIEQKAGKTRYFRGKTIGYMAVIGIMLFALLKMGSEKEHMLLNINKETRLYSIKDAPDGGKRVTNGYTFLFQNTDNEDHTYYFKVDDPRIKILRPSNSFKIRAGSKSKKVVVLYTDEVLANDPRKDVTLHVTIEAFAKDNPEKIKVTREAIFVYPRKDLIEQ